MSDRPAPDGAFSDKDPLPPSSPKRYDERDDEPLPSLARGNDGSALKSLAQSAREKQLSTARILLFIIGVIQIGISSFEMITLVNDFGNAGQIQQFAPQLQADIFRVQIIVGLFLCAGVTYLILGALVKKYPLPCTILGLVIFLLVQVVAAINNPLAIWQGIIFKVAFLVSFISAIKAARAYEAERAQESFAD